MTILVIAPRMPYPLADGYSRAVYHPLRYLAAKGHRVILCTLTDSPSPEGVNGLAGFCDVFPFSKETKRTVSGMVKSLFSGESYYLNRFHEKAFLEKILFLVAREKPDVIQLEQLHCAYYGAGIKKQFDIPIILRLHNIESDIVARFGSQSRNPVARIYAFLEAEKIRKYEKAVSPLFDRLLTISPDDDHQLRDLQPAARSTVVPSGVDTAFFSPRKAQDAPDSILLLAAFHWRPNQDSFWWFVNHVLPFIVSRKPGARISVVGTNPTKEMLAFRHKNVTVIGAVDDVREHIARNRVSIVPLRIGGGIRLKLLELFAMGRAVVSTTIGCEGLDVSKDIHLKIEDTAQGFADAIINLMDDPIARTTMGEAARNLVLQRYSWDAVLPPYEELCLTLIR